MENDELLQPGEAAKRLGVHPKTLTRWTKAGKIPSVRTLGGHRRYQASVVAAIVSGKYNRP